jgi:murein DD-endopeptidase MepM/ murein hydrolase activator NlpD
LAFQHFDADQVSTSAPGSAPIDPGSVAPGSLPAEGTSRKRTSTRRIAMAAALGAILVAAAAIPVGASWPVATKNSYVSQWSSSRHIALDIAAPGGTRIIPIRSGKVIFAGWKSNCGGWQVWVNHGNGLYSAYYHMSRHTSYAGKPVTRQTTTLGYVGKTGCATGNHVHLEVWRGYPWRSGSYRVNPKNYVMTGTYLPNRYR